MYNIKLFFYTCAVYIINNNLNKNVYTSFYTSIYVNMHIFHVNTDV